MNARDEDFLRQALALARRGEGHTRPNPPVGAVVVQGDRIVGRGFHRRCGGPHAETAALADARRHLGGILPPGLEVFVTLEPCSRPGRVGACTDALAAARVSRVLYACPDPNPTNRGRAARVLARAGVACAPAPRASSVRTDAARLIAPFAKHVTTALPFVTVKLAMSLDGRIADRFGDARWVSSAAARRATGSLRTRVDAILVGAETVRRDNPSLLSHGRRNDDLLRVVVTRSGNLPKTARIFTDGRNETLVLRVGGRGAPFATLREALAELGRRGLLHVLCEGGLDLARSLAAEGLVDEWLTVLAPKVIGSQPIGEARCFRRVPGDFADFRGDEAFVTATSAVTVGGVVPSAFA